MKVMKPLSFMSRGERTLMLALNRGVRSPMQRRQTMVDTSRLVGWGLTALLTQNRSYRACKFVGIFHRSKL